MIQIHPQLTQFVRPSEHSKFSPSSADRWIACPFSIDYTKDIPTETGPWAEEGTLAHSVCEAVFYQAFEGRPWDHDTAIKFGMQPTEVQTEMFDAACRYLEIIRSWLTCGHLGEILWYGVERGIPIFPEEECFGTGDFVAIGTKGALVLDFKFGRKHVPKNSVQLRTYLAGVYRYLIDVPSDYIFHSVIFQPRLDIVPKHHEYIVHDIAKHLEIIWQAINESKRKDLQPNELSESGDHCFWCPAKRTKEINLMCPIKRDRPVELMKETFGTYLKNLNAPVAKLGDPNPKRDEALMKIIALRPLINSLANDGEEELIGRLARGEYIEGVSVEQVPGNRRWMHDDPEEVAKIIRFHFPQVEPFQEVKKLTTITEVEAVVGKGKCDAYTVRPLKKKLKMQDARQREILGALSSFANKLTQDVAEEE